jgi:hypothetical protein
MPADAFDYTEDWTDAVLVAVYERLDEIEVSVDGTDRVIQCYTAVVPNAKLPYYRLSNPRMVEDGAQQGASYGGAQEVRIQLDAFSWDGDTETVGALKSAAFRQLAASPLPLDGATVTFATMEGSSSPPDEDAEHGVVDLYFRVQPGI